MERHRVAVDGAELLVRVAGPVDGVPLVLLHGWPDTGDCWNGVARHLEDRFRLIIPDNRGFGESSMPPSVDDYRIHVVIGDVLRLAEWAGWDRFSIVGHDFGGPVAWGAGMFVPESIERIGVMCAPHPLMWKRVASRDLGQWRRSFYVWLLNGGDPGLRLLAADDFRMLGRFAFGDALSAEELDRRRANWREPGRFAAMARWYQAGYTPDLVNPDVPLDLPPVKVPTLYVHGLDDWAFSERMAHGNGEFVDAQYEEWLVPDAGHWLPYTHPEQVANRLRQWLDRSG